MDSPTEPPLQPPAPPDPGISRRYGPGLLIALLLSAGALVAGWELWPALVALPAIVLGLFLYPPGRHRHKARYPGAPWGVGAAIFLVCQLFIFQWLILTVWWFFRGGASTVTLLTLSGLGSLSAAGVAVLHLRSRGLTPAAIGLTASTLVPGAMQGIRLGVILVTLNVLFVKFSSTADIWTLAGTEVTAMLYNAEDLVTGVVCMLLAMLVAPLAEEILFRGVLFTALRRSRGAFWATIVSSFFFGVVHGVTAVMVTLFGLGFAIAYHLTGTLWTSIFAHAVLNGVTAAIAWNHGHWTTRISWGELGLVFALLGLVFPVTGWVLARSNAGIEDGPCPTCGEKERAGKRCRACATPLRPVGKWTRRLLEVAASGYLFLAAGLACGMHALLNMGYHPALPGPVLLLQAGLQSGIDHERGLSLTRRWVQERPDDPMGRIALSGFLYQRGDFVETMKVIQPALSKGMPLDPAFQLQNVLSLALAELGHAEVAVDLAHAAHGSAPPEYRPAIEDTWGWALANQGRLSEASAHVENAVSSMDFLRRADVAELSYHRGLLHIASGEEARGRELLGDAARTGTAGHWFARRARELLAAGKMPPDLLPVELSRETSRARLARTALAEGTGDVRAVSGAAALRERIAKQPASAAARLRLIGILLGPPGKDPPPADAKEILDHLVWLIQNAPDEAALPALPVERLPSSDGFRQGLLAAWRATVEGKPSSTEPLRAAARMSAAADPVFAVSCLERAFHLRPNAVVREELARARLHVISVTTGPERAAAARTALEWLAATDPDRGRPRPGLPRGPDWALGLTELSRRAVVALEARDGASAERYANALIDMASLFLGGQTGPRATAQHLGHIVLGHLKLRAGDRENARRHLQVASFQPAPELGGWNGPDLSLARLLARRGHPEAAAEYLTTWNEIKPPIMGIPTVSRLIRMPPGEATGLFRWVLEDLAVAGHAGGPG